MSRLHWYGPRSHRPGSRLYDPPLRRARYKLYVPDGMSGGRYEQDRHGTYVWMGTDCGWQWLATRPGIYRTWLAIPFDALCDHVHRAPKPDIVLRGAEGSIVGRLPGIHGSAMVNQIIDQLLGRRS